MREFKQNKPREKHMIETKTFWVFIVLASFTFMSWELYKHLN